jgi:hypothetical protein
VLRGVAAAVVIAVACGSAVASAAPATYTLAFGRTGGNIIPFRVTVTTAGRVQVTGPVRVGRTRLTAAQIAAVERVVVKERFAALPSSTSCPGTLPDVATTYVVADGRTVRVHGGCRPRFTAVFTALGAAVKISY